MNEIEYNMCWLEGTSLLTWTLRQTTDAIVAWWLGAAPAPSWVSAYLAFNWRSVKRPWANEVLSQYDLSSGRAANERHLSVV